MQIIDVGPNQVGESPIWDGRDQSLWWVDIESCLIKKWSSMSGQIEQWQMPERVGCIALIQDGRILAALEYTIVALKLHEAGHFEIQELARVNHPGTGMRFNDGRCDPSGRFWVGTMVMDMASNRGLGGLYCLDERGLTGPHVAGLYTPNGSAFSPNGSVFYLSDSHSLSQEVWAFDYDAQNGTLSRRRPYIDMRPRPGRPDGAAVDMQGNYWICGNDAGQVHCFNPQGALLKSLDVPFPKPAMCCFGGANMDLLFVTSIVPGAGFQGDVGLSGAVVALKPGTQGMPEPRFSRFP
jgi:sugar lactone lactonase YvrE